MKVNWIFEFHHSIRFWTSSTTWKDRFQPLYQVVFTDFRNKLTYFLTHVSFVLKQSAWLESLFEKHCWSVGPACGLKNKRSRQLMQTGVFPVFSGWPVVCRTGQVNFFTHELVSGSISRHSGPERIPVVRSNTAAQGGYRHRPEKCDRRSS